MPRLWLQCCITIYEFAEEFFTGYMRSYLAFRHRKPEFIKWQFDLPDLSDFAHEVQDEFAISSCARYERSVARSTPYGLTRWLINFPMGAARIVNMPTVMFIDEFQVLTNVYNPKDDRILEPTAFKKRPKLAGHLYLSRALRFRS